MHALRFESSLRFSAAFCAIVLALAATTRAPRAYAASPQSPPQHGAVSMNSTDHEALGIADKIWENQLFQCGPFIINENNQYRGVHRYVIKSGLDEADKMNGVTWHGYLAVEPRLTRPYYPNGTMGDWAMPATAFSDELAKHHINGNEILREEVVGENNRDFWDKQYSLVAKVKIEKKNGEWMAPDEYESVDKLIDWMKNQNTLRRDQYKNMCSQ